MRIVFVLRRPSLVRYYASTLGLLADRGHDIVLVFSELVGKGDAAPDLGVADELRREHPGQISYVEAPQVSPAAGWRGIAGTVRMWGDFCRFLDPTYADTPRLRARLATRVRPERAARLLQRVQSATVARGGAWLARRLEEAIPPMPEVVAFLRALDPGVVVVSPLVDPGTDQVEFVKASRALGIPSAGAIASWDNLSSKGVIRLGPDRLLVWNSIQVDEAESMHGLERERVVITGAPRWDPWFERSPSRSQSDLRRTAGLAVDQPYLLYLCSSAFIAPDEPSFVRRWLGALREDRVLADVGVLIRPHPQNASVWADVDLTEHGNVAVWPRAGENVDDEEARSTFYDSIAHAVAIVGANTSALVEAAIIGKRVYTLAESAVGQRGTVHYRYLLEENGGFLKEAKTLEEHLADLRGSIERGDGETPTRFVESFVRPRGLARPATDVLADEIEAAARLAPTPLPSGPTTRILHAALAAAAAVRRVRRRRSSFGTVRA